MNTTLHRAILKAGVASALMMVAVPAVAQEAQQAEELQETIVVTGSRIARPELQSSSPVSVVGSEDFQLSGAVNVEEVLYDLPQVVPSLTAASNNPGEGVATIDLRGLGANRTLVLVNGRRYVSYDEQQIVDLNTVPAALIERVDVVTGGRSAVYGSDAIAGVVNFILKKDFEGVQVSGNYRLTEKGDGNTYVIDGLVGGNFADGKGNATLYLSYAKRKSILQADRAFSRRTLGDNGDGTTYFGGSSSILNNRYAIGNYGATPDSRTPISTGNRRYENSGGSSVAYNPTTDAYNYAPDNYLQTPQERWMVGGFAHYEINEHFGVFAEGQFIRSRVDTQLAPTPVTGSFNVAVDNPYLSASEQAMFRQIDLAELQGRVDASGKPVLDDDGNQIYDPASTRGNGYVRPSIGRRFAEAGPRHQVDDRYAYRALIGVRGDIAGGWAYETYYSYAHNRNVQTQEGNVSVSRFQNALDVEVVDGQIRCKSAAARAQGCAPLNIFGQNTASKEAVAYVTVPTSNLNTITDQVASFTVNNGELFDLGAGPAGIALGAEWRSSSGQFRPDFYLSSGDIVGFNAGAPTQGSYSVKELFGEVAIPLLADQAFAEKLEFNGAVRYSDYSNAVGTAVSYAAGLSWAPVQDITFRGQYQRAVRAPTIYDLFRGQSVGFPTATDPCEQPIAKTNATLNATCRAQGVAADAIGTTFIGTSQIESYFSGNPDLKEEKADTYTIGAVIQPTFLPRFTMTVDYYNITVKDYIGSSGPGTVNLLRACYGDAASNYTPYDTSYCSQVPRNPDSKELEGAISTNLNLGKLKASGVDFEARYWFNVPFGFENDGRFDIRLTGTRLIEWKLNPIASEPDLVNDCAGKFGNTCGEPFSKWRTTVRTTYSTGPLTASLSWRYLSSAKDDDDGATFYREKFDAYHLFDMSANYQVSENLDFTFGIDNLFNNKPQLAGDNQQQSNTFPSTYDVFGRRYFFSATAKF